MTMTRVLDFPVIFESDETGGYVAVCPTIPGCYSQGSDLAEAEENIRECIEMCLDEMEARGEALPSARSRLVGHIVIAR
jgi:predicted RNase H-like HicB family nuclease